MALRVRGEYGIPRRDDGVSETEHGHDCLYCAAGESQIHNYEPPERNDDDPCPCGISHTRSEHGYDPDRD